MLVYANHFTLTGSDSSAAAFRSIAGWLSRKTGRNFGIPEILSGNEFRQGIYQVRTYAADKREPKLYSILLTHRDDEIYGRFWSTEISVRLEVASTFISILLETQEISTRITEIPVTTRPALVNYLALNAEFAAGTVGLKLRTVTNSDSDYQALGYEIQNPKRDYPLVLVSCCDGQPLVDPEALQRQLFGLAQVIAVDETCDSRKMVRFLSSTYSAWDGAVNIVFPYLAYKGFCYRDLIRWPELEELQQESDTPQEGAKRVLYDILARVTHSTNWLKRRQHFSPADVRAKRQKDYLLYLQEQAKENGDYKKLFDLACEEQEQQNVLIKQLEQEKQAAEDATIKAWEQKEEAEKVLKRQAYNVSKPGRKASAAKSKADITEAVLVLAGQKKLTPRLCLELAAQQSGNIVILESALKSADKAEDYHNSRNLLAALCKLGGKFLPAYLSGGDNKTEGVFSRDTYAAKESGQTMNNPKCKAARTFSYKGEEVTMWQHLGWGVADNTRESLRLYFYVDQKEGKIVIGHCGEHLETITSRSV